MAITEVYGAGDTAVAPNSTELVVDNQSGNRWVTLIVANDGGGSVYFGRTSSVGTNGIKAFESSGRTHEFVLASNEELWVHAPSSNGDTARVAALVRRYP